MHPAIAKLEQLGVKRTRLVVDSRDVAPGDVFAAFAGATKDGRDFIEAAARAGAVAVIAQAGSNCATSAAVPVIAVENLPLVLGVIADDFYDRPSAAMSVSAVTGTNGKTTVATWLAQAENALGGKGGFIGTTGIGFMDSLKPSKNTTPDAATVHGTLAYMRSLGATNVGMEVSSHALDQGRVAGVRFDVAVFTNLTQDHLDYHQTMAAYGEAKARLFTDYSVRHRVINADDAFGSQLIARHYPNVVTYGMQGGEVRGRIVNTDRESMLLQIDSAWGKFEATIATVGKFNAYNALAIAASLLCRNVSVKLVTHALQSLRAAPGRMQRVNPVGPDAGPSVYVDYAHTPDALEKAIAAAREACTGALWVVFGCGGDRDATKRPVMGAIAAKGADVAIVTSDNPRTESPSAIISQVLSGFPASRRARVEEIVDRRDAILRAIHAAANDDTVLIAGKGHEDYQEIGGERIHFSDIEVAERALAERNVAMERSHATH